MVDTSARRAPVPPRSHCPPSLRGHAWREPTIEEWTGMNTPTSRYALRLCKRCGKLGCVNKQGVVKEVP